MSSYYGTISEAAIYFGNRLHATAWNDALVADRPKALIAATQIIDTLAFKGYKASVYELLESNSAAACADVRVAEAAQALEFPRGADTDVPDAIKQACFEIAYSLLDGKDPELELEALGVSSFRYATVTTAYDRQQSPLEHLVNGVPSALAWRILRPYLRDDTGVNLSRIS